MPILIAHTSLSPAFYLLLIVVGDGAVNNFGSYIQWRSELFKPRTLSLCVGRGTMNNPRYWELYDASGAVETSANTPRFSYR
jgi:hypothetical protein